MSKIIRYTLAAICLAASIGSLALWRRSATYVDVVVSPKLYGTQRVAVLQSFKGSLTIRSMLALPTAHPYASWRVVSWSGLTGRGPLLPLPLAPKKQFGKELRGFFFPLWYAALLFALAAVAALRLGRRFTLRSALITTAVVAALLGMPVAL